MHVSLTPELEEAVKRKVQSGLYNNANDVIREALRWTGNPRGSRLPDEAGAAAAKLAEASAT